jgi:hypothetical protein
MIEPRPSVNLLVHAAAGAELELGGDEQGSAAAQRILLRLHHQLAELIGSAGFDVLLARSLALAQRAHPALARITAGPNGRLEGLPDFGREGARLDAEMLAIVCHFVELLVTLLGEDLAMRMIRDMWPAVADGERHEQQP